MEPGKAFPAKTLEQKLPDAPARIAAIAFCADALMELPLHVAAFALFRNLSARAVPHFYMLLTGFKPAMKNLLRRTLDSLHRPYQLTFLSDDMTDVFRSFRGLMGNHTPYHRLLLPDMIEEPVFLYVDADTLTLLDVAPLFELDMGPCATGFVVSGTVDFSLDRDFFLSLGMSRDRPVFNSGVMLVQREEWKKQKCWERIKAFCQKYSDKLCAADQTVLNALFAEECYRLPPEFNVGVRPVRQAKVGRAPGLYHFVGSPKPWDFLGRHLLPASQSWFDELERTPLPWMKQRVSLTQGYWKRLPGLCGGYRRLFKS
jgi:lipopolysaccharide biosynthesis glycosyltransferase